MKVLVTGDRYWTDKDYVFRILDGFHATGPITLIIEGCATGADNCAELWAWKNEVPIEHHPANWKKYGYGAGPIRNREMLDRNPDLIIAVHADLQQSKGTMNMIRQAQGRRFSIFWYDGNPELRRKAL